MATRSWPRVIVFSTPTCPYCQAAKRYLQQRGVPFEDEDVSQNMIAAQYMVQRSGQQGVPVIQVGNEVVVGFDRARLDALLGLQ
ncbi:MAG: glutaredoxin family protein [Chloroflexi bacterium]|nr:glutaredoxin family protein [Chloroflexota bacterium]OQB01524.1 MAG: Glutaredoxin-3 [Chloroflexi bacterium ADurb.Bin222]HOC20856.1 glutaredoxin family protein [Anaerolineae bacterium]HOS79851.1 glutaredoxin family protein [Anaerolineae bacterium]HQJ11043.1 glutaredoxin family protein [Anaerolineae bacterium]